MIIHLIFAIFLSFLSHDAVFAGSLPEPEFTYPGKKTVIFDDTEETRKKNEQNPSVNNLLPKREKDASLPKQAETEAEIDLENLKRQVEFESGKGDFPEKPEFKRSKEESFSGSDTEKDRFANDPYMIIAPKTAPGEADVFPSKRRGR